MARENDLCEHWQLDAAAPKSFSQRHKNDLPCGLFFGTFAPKAAKALPVP
jgi:hypothetical protein